MPTDEDSSAAWAQALTLDDPRLFQNRELSLLSFQKRVLGEANESSNPLLERLNFLSIFSSNIDEFFMVRVAGLKQKAASGIGAATAGGMSGTELLETIRSEVVRLTDEAYRCLRDDIRPELGRAGIVLVDYADLGEEERTRLNEYFQRTVFLVLAPLAFDPGRPFPHISNLSLNLAVVVQDARGEERFARVKIPALRVAGAVDRRQLAVSFPGTRSQGSSSVPRHAGCGDLHSGTRKRRSPRDDRRSGLAAKIPRRGPLAGGYQDLGADPRDPDQPARTHGQGRLPDRRSPGLETLAGAIRPGPAGAQVQTVPSLHSAGSAAQCARGYIRANPRRRCSPAPPLRILPAGGGVHPAGYARSGRSRD